MMHASPPDIHRVDHARPIRVFHLVKSLGRGGAEVLLAEGLRVADRERFTLGYGYFTPWKNAVVPQLEAQGADVRCFSADSNAAILLSTLRVARFLRAWRADLVHCHLAIAAVTGRLAARLAGIPAVCTQHNEVERTHPITRALDVATWNLQDGAVAISERVAESIHEHAARRVPVRVVHNGVNVDQFAPGSFPGADGRAVREDLGIPAGAPVVGTVAVFTRQKRIDWWLEAARRIRERHPNAHFVIVGDGPLRDELHRYSERLGLDACVHFAGLQEDVRPYLAAMDVYLMSSEYEGFGVALIEAMALERAVVSTGVGGILNIITDGEHGRLAPPADVDALARISSELLADAGERERLGRAARQTVAERFSMRRMARELEAFYLDVLARRGRDVASLRTTPHEVSHV